MKLRFGKRKTSKPESPNRRVVRESSSIHAPTKCARNHAVRAYDMNRATPTTDTVPVNTSEQALRHHLEQLLGLHVGLVQALGNTVQLLSAATTDRKIFRKASSSEKIGCPDEGLVVLVEPSNDRFAKVRAESSAIKHGRNKLETGLGRDVTLFAKVVPKKPRYTTS